MEARKIGARMVSRKACPGVEGGLRMKKNTKCYLILENFTVVCAHFTGLEEAANVPGVLMATRLPRLSLALARALRREADDPEKEKESGQGSVS